MEWVEINNLFRLIFLIFVTGSVVVSAVLLSTFKRSDVINGFTLGITSVLSIVVSGITLIIMGYVADEIGGSGDAISTYLFLGIIGLSLVNGGIYAKKRR